MRNDGLDSRGWVEGRLLALALATGVCLRGVFLIRLVVAEPVEDEDGDDWTPGCGVDWTPDCAVDWAPDCGEAK